MARVGLAKTTVEDVAREAGVSRATLYRSFPGGRDALVSATIARETEAFFVELAEAVAGADTLAAVIEEALLHAAVAVRDHVLLQTLLRTEPELLLPLLTIDVGQLLPAIASFFEPYIAEEDLRPGIDVSEVGEYVARMVLSHINAPGRWDMADRASIAELVRVEVLAGIVCKQVASGDRGSG